MAKRLSSGNIVILAAAAVMLIASFLDFWKVDFGFGFGSDEEGFSAWSGDLFFPASIIPVLCALAMAVHVVLTTFADTNLPERVLGMGWNQIHLALGLHAAVMMLAWTVVDKEPFDIGIGFWLMLLSGVALAVGAFLRTKESEGTTAL